VVVASTLWGRVVLAWVVALQLGSSRSCCCRRGSVVFGM
jgi:hypothetical protein